MEARKPEGKQWKRIGSQVIAAFWQGGSQENEEKAMEKDRLPGKRWVLARWRPGKLKKLKGKCEVGLARISQSV